jgi:ABC-type lipoprotein export system ATPase subunit
MPGAAIHVNGLTHRYRTARGPGRGRDPGLTVLDGVDLHVDAGEHVVVTGASGSGKSTLLAVLGGLDPPQEGSVVVDGHDLHDLSRNALADFRRETVGFVFQHFGLLDTLTAAENVELAGTLAGRPLRPRRRRAAELLAAVGLAGRAHHQPTALSGGERQRVAVARALVNEPRLVLADEPTGNLDDDSSALVVGLLESLPAQHGCTLLIVSHDRRLSARAPRHLHLAGGKVHAVDIDPDIDPGTDADPDSPRPRVPAGDR